MDNEINISKVVANFNEGEGNGFISKLCVILQVILSHATHLYYDHPQEPSPEERGYYWATRFTDVSKTFGYNAIDVYENIQETL